MGFLNIAGYFDKLFEFINTCEKYGFISNEQVNIPRIYADVQELLNDLFV